MGIGPVYAIPRLLERNGLTMDDIDLWELNEAFASQVIYCRDRLGIPMEKLNVNGVQSLSVIPSVSPAPAKQATPLLKASAGARNTW